MISISFDLGGCGEDVAYPYALTELLIQILVTVGRENWWKPAKAVCPFGF